MKRRRIGYASMVRGPRRRRGSSAPCYCHNTCVACYVVKG